MSTDLSEKFCWAVKNGEVDEVKKLLQENKTLAQDADKSSGRPLACVAADYGQTEVLDILIKSGIQINVVDKFGISPLLSAIFESHEECVKLLLAKGADKSLKAPDGRSYVDCAEKESIKALLTS